MLLRQLLDRATRTYTYVLADERTRDAVIGKSREEFVAIMDALHLPTIAKADEALSANRACGCKDPA